MAVTLLHISAVQAGGRSSGRPAQNAVPLAVVALYRAKRRNLLAKIDVFCLCPPRQFELGIRQAVCRDDGGGRRGGRFLRHSVQVGGFVVALVHDHRPALRGF